MKKLMSLFLASAFLATVPAFAFEEAAPQSGDEAIVTQDLQTGELTPFDSETMSPLRRGGDGWGRGGDHRGGDGWDRGGDRWGRGGHWGRGGGRYCDRRPSYRWDRFLRRWIFVGWTCRYYGGYDVESGETAQ